MLLTNSFSLLILEKSAFKFLLKKKVSKFKISELSTLLQVDLIRNEVDERILLQSLEVLARFPDDEFDFHVTDLFLMPNDDVGNLFVVFPDHAKNCPRSIYFPGDNSIYVFYEDNEKNFETTLDSFNWLEIIKSSQ
jgi:hypothetical protein